MKYLQRQADFERLRKKHPEFNYDEFDYSVHEDKIDISYVFSLGKDIVFRPGISIVLTDDMDKSIVETKLFRDLVFNAGMIELISYWKAAASPKIHIRTGSLSSENILWWKDLYYKGLGEYFFVNGINIGIDDFVSIIPSNTEHNGINHLEGIKDHCIVPVGGGKDSIVSLEILKQWDGGIFPMTINPTAASWRSIITAGYTKTGTIVFNRRIDPQLLELNAQGYLNGHTPFSAVIAFYSLMAASLCRSRYVVLSNESSASEATVPGTDINHQYSKSIEFERNFRKYVHNQVEENINYFSLLRPVNEFQIAGMFSGMPQYHSEFRSCNVGSKSDVWCGNCPKCLFTYIILHPFLGDEGLQKIFNKNLFDDEELWPVMQELTGIAEHKPFECVGTVDEVRYALAISIRNHEGESLPPLLQMINTEGMGFRFDDQRMSFRKLSPKHFIPDNILRLLNNVLWETELPA